MCSKSVLSLPRAVAALLQPFASTHTAMCPTGALLGIFLARHISAVMPLSEGKEPYGTRDMGILLVVLTASCALTLGFITLWIGLLLRPQKAADPAAASAPAPTATPAAAEASKGATIMPAAAALPHIGTTARLMAAEKGGKAPLSLVMPPTAATACSHQSYPVAAGRPDTQQLISSWLATLQQLPDVGKDVSSDGGRQLQCPVLGCGPTALLHDTQMLVQDLNAQQARRHVGRVRMHFVRKTFAL